ncbi:MAG: IS1182 family transposase, partial [Marinifilaceae bacterium]
KDSFSGIFTQVVELLHEYGFISLDVQYIDGTKIESMANKYTFVWRKSVEKNNTKLKAKTQAVLDQIEQQINFEETDNNTSCDNVEDFQERLDKINAELEKKEVPKKIRKAVDKVQLETIPKLQHYRDQLSKMETRNSYSKTDEEATFMRMKEDAMLNGQLKPGYNIQISTENQFITHYAIYQRPTDSMTLIPFLKDFQERYNRQSGIIVADSRYGSEQNYEWMFNAGITPFVKFNYFHAEQKRTYKNNPFLSANLYYNPIKNYYECPMGQHLTFVRDEKRKTDAGYVSTVSIYKAKRCKGCPLRSMCHKSKNNRQIEVNHKLNQYKDEVRTLLKSPEGLYHRGKRPIEPEAVFGHIKECGSFRRFRLRGLKGAEIEFGLKALAHNMRKLALLGYNIVFFPNFENEKGILLINRGSQKHEIRSKVA